MPPLLHNNQQEKKKHWENEIPTFSWTNFSCWDKVAKKKRILSNL